MDSVIAAAYQSPVRRFSTDLDKRNSPLEVNRLKSLLEKSTENPEDVPTKTKKAGTKTDVLVKLKSGTVVKLCSYCATENSSTDVSQTEDATKVTQKPKAQPKRPRQRATKTGIVNSTDTSTSFTKDNEETAGKDTTAKVRRPRKTKKAEQEKIEGAVVVNVNESSHLNENIQAEGNVQINNIDSQSNKSEPAKRKRVTRKTLKSDKQNIENSLDTSNKTVNAKSTKITKSAKIADGQNSTINDTIIDKTIRDEAILDAHNTVINNSNIVASDIAASVSNTSKTRKTRAATKKVSQANQSNTEKQNVSHVLNNEEAHLNNNSVDDHILKDAVVHSTSIEDNNDEHSGLSKNKMLTKSQLKKLQEVAKEKSIINETLQTDNQESGNNQSVTTDVAKQGRTRRKVITKRNETSKLINTDENGKENSVVNNSAFDHSVQDNGVSQYDTSYNNTITETASNMDRSKKSRATTTKGSQDKISKLKKQDTTSKTNNAEEHLKNNSVAGNINEHSRNDKDKTITNDETIQGHVFNIRNVKTEPMDIFQSSISNDNTILKSTVESENLKSTETKNVSFADKQKDRSKTAKNASFAKKDKDKSKTEKTKHHHQTENKSDKKSHKKNKKAEKKHKNDKKMVKALATMSRYFKNVHIDNINEVHLGTLIDADLSFDSLSECSSSCSCASTDESSDSDYSECNCFRCMMQDDDSTESSDETSSTTSDESTTDTTDSSSTESSPSLERYRRRKRSHKSCKSYDLNL